MFEADFVPVWKTRAFWMRVFLIKYQFSGSNSQRSYRLGFFLDMPQNSSRWLAENGAWLSQARRLVWLTLPCSYGVGGMSPLGLYLQRVLMQTVFLWRRCSVLHLWVDESPIPAPSLEPGREWGLPSMLEHLGMWLHLQTEFCVT